MFDLNISYLAVLIPAILFTISIHEFSHGLVAHYLGDPTPSMQGRLTLNPLAHIDILGLVMMIIARFGWAKPVQVNPLNFRGDRTRGMMLVAVAGPVSNIIVALCCAILYNLFSSRLAPGGFVETLLSLLLIYNVYLALFNLIPVPPLDGSKILRGFLPRNMHRYYYQLESYGPIILIVLIMSGATSRILGTFAYKVINMLLSIGGVIAGGF